MKGSQLITRLCEAQADVLGLPPAQRTQFIVECQQRLHAEFLRAYPDHRGETVVVRLFRPGRDPLERQRARDRIVAALQAGQRPADIARREGVSRQWVHKLRAVLSTAKP